jgi:DNA-binding GntR family transcriptional regulator
MPAMPKPPLAPTSAAVPSRARPLPALPEQIAAELAAAVLRGDYEPGQAILEQRVAAQFDVSRAPVREALRILERDGVVVMAPRKGARVTRLTRVEVAEIYEVRAHLFGLAARLFAERCPDEALAALRAGVEDLAALRARAGQDIAEAHAGASAALALLMTDGCGNAKLAQLVHHMARQVARYTRLGLSTPERRRESLASWRQLLRAAMARDGALAETTARQMVERTCAQAIARLEPEG